MAGYVPATLYLSKKVEVENMKANDLIGERFGRLTVLSRAESTKGGKAQWNCKCDCGSKTTTNTSNLKNGHTRSCGCLRKESSSKIHGKNLIGMRFGYLEVVSKYGSGKNKEVIWNCKCECGNNTRVRTGNLLRGSAKSCGCLRCEGTHNLSRSRLYRIWVDMKERCERESSNSYSNYGGRGITICDEWHKFEIFAKWALENGYKDNLTIERKDINKNYSPENCCWITHRKQQWNKRTNYVVEYNGEKKCLAEWCVILNLNYRKTYQRLKYGKWKVSKAFEN